MAEKGRDYEKIGYLRREIDVEGAFGVTTTDLFLCPDCGAAVVLRDEHDEFHVVREST